MAKTIALLIFPGVQCLDVAGPLDVFAEANAFIGQDNGYQMTLVGTDRAPLRASNGMLMAADVDLAEARSCYDLLLVAGGPLLPTCGSDLDCLAYSDTAFCQQGYCCAGKLVSVEPKSGGLQVINEVTVEMEGSEKPACVAELLTLIFK